MNEAMLQLPGRVHVEPDVDALFDTLGQAMMDSAQAAIEARGVFHLALSGGSSPEPFYRHLVTDPKWRDFPWSKTHLWIVDERRVSEDDERSNMAMIRAALTDHVMIPARQIHPMPVMENDPATLYEQTLHRHVNQSEADEPPTEQAPTPRLDFILLGMGGDCHTASLFPNSPAIEVTGRWIAVNEGPAVTPPDRVTMTFPLINAGRTVAPLIMGGKKFEALKRIEQKLETHGPAPRELPITGIQPEAGALHWYLDAAATGVVTE